MEGSPSGKASSDTPNATSCRVSFVRFEYLPAHAVTGSGTSVT
jgi:hypothetical protein